MSYNLERPLTFGSIFRDADLSIACDDVVCALLAEDQAMALMAWHDQATYLRKDLTSFLGVFTPNLVTEDKQVAARVREVGIYLIEQLKQVGILQITSGKKVRFTKSFDLIIDTVRRLPRDPGTGRIIICNRDFILGKAVGTKPFIEPIMQPHRDFGYIFLDRLRGYVKQDRSNLERYSQLDPAALQEIYIEWVQGENTATKTSLTAIIKAKGYIGKFVPTHVSKMILDRFLLTRVVKASVKVNFVRKKPVAYEPTPKGQLAMRGYIDGVRLIPPVYVNQFVKRP